MSELKLEHVTKVISLLHKQGIADLVKKHKMLVGGGCIRAVVADETTSDIDLFLSEKPSDELFADFELVFPHRQIIRTANATTYAVKKETPVQVISRWVFKDDWELLDHFDFSICGAVVRFNGTLWTGIVHHNFYEHLEAKKLVYTNPPLGACEPGGSLLRVMKYVSRGYYCSPESLSRIMARMMLRVDSPHQLGEERLRAVLDGMLREVDPATVEGVDLTVG